MDTPSIAIVYNLLLVGVAWFTSRLAPPASALKLRRKFDPVLSVRASNRIQLTLENEGLERVVGVLRDEPPLSFSATRKEFPVDIPPESVAEYEYVLTPFDRGSDYFRGTFLRLKCPLGLVERQIKLQTEQPVRVYPNVLALKEFELLKQQGRLREIGIRRSRVRGLGTEFESLRDYGEGDDYRKIDWKASARRSKLVVRQYEQERNQSVVICIDVGRLMLSEVEGVRKLDHALDSSLMLLHAASMAGDYVGLLVYGDNVFRYIPPRKGRNQVGIIIEALHDLMANPIESDPATAFAYFAARWKRRSLMVVFTDCEEAHKARDLAVALGPLATRHLILVALISDARFAEALDLKVETANDMYLKASATLLQHDRKAAAGVLSASRIHTLEAEPQDLAAALVSYYFMVKERSIL